MVKKFEEFVNEIWSKGTNRNVTGEERLGTKPSPFFEEDDIYEVVGFPEYYISNRGEFGNIVVYHAPSEEEICTYDNLYFPEDEFIKGHEYWEDYTVSDNISPEDEKLMVDDDFIEGIYKTLMSA